MDDLEVNMGSCLVKLTKFALTAQDVYMTPGLFHSNADIDRMKFQCTAVLPQVIHARFYTAGWADTQW